MAPVAIGAKKFIVITDNVRRRANAHYFLRLYLIFTDATP
jgi:hypothetical protein